MTRWTEAEAIQYGFVKNSDGNWYSPHAWKALQKSQTQTRRQGNVSRPAAQSKPTASRRDERKTERDSTGKAKDSKGETAKTKKQGQYLIRIIMHYSREMDPDNWVYKWYLDHLVHRGYLPDDSTRYVKKVIHEHVQVDSPDKQKTVIEIYRL